MQPRPARRHQGVHHVQIVTASPVQTATVFCCTNLPQPRSLVDTLVRLWCDSPSPVLWTEPTLWCYHLQFLPDTDNLLTPCWKWQISSFQPAPTIIALNWANERRVCVRLSQPMTVKRKHRCDDMCWKLQDTCRFEQGVFSLFLPSELSSLWADCTIQWKFMLIQTGSQPSHLLASIIKNYHQLTHHHHNKSIKQCLVKMKPKKLWASWVVLVMLICT